MSTVIRGAAARRVMPRPTTGDVLDDIVPPEPTTVTPLPNGPNPVIRLYPPSGKGVHGRYWRINPLGGRPGRTTAKDWPSAWEAAMKLLAGVQADAGGRPRQTVAKAVARWTARHPAGDGARTARRIPRSPRPWSAEYARRQEVRLKLFVAEFGDSRCQDLKFTDMRRFLEALPSHNAELEMVKTLTTLTRWMEANDYLLPRQNIHARTAGYELSKPATGGRLGGHHVPHTGAAPGHVPPDAIPTHDAMHAAASAMVRRTRNGRETTELEILLLLAGYAGPRLGELLALTADHVQENGTVLHVREQTRERPTKTGIRTGPTKGSTWRQVPVLPTTPRGFPLVDRLNARAKAAQAERCAGTNPNALLFPCTNGRDPWSRSNLRNRYFYPAISADAAQWPTVEVDGIARQLWTFHSLRHAAATYLLHEVRDSDGRPLSPAQVAQVLGHSDEHTTTGQYVDHTAWTTAHVTAALAATARRVGGP